MGPTVLALKLDKGKVLGVGVATIPHGLFLTYFSNHEDNSSILTTFGME